MRAAIEHNLLYDGPQRLWYIGPMFRHERPQKGRYRQFHQVGVEALGFAGPDVDAEQIVMLHAPVATLGLDGIALQINSLGEPESARPSRRTDRVPRAACRPSSTKTRSAGCTRNPLRILDTKNPAMQELIAARRS